MSNVFLFILIFCFSATLAQESNYANYEVGANSTMMGGAITAGVKDNSAVYYNPGALAFVEKSNVTLETGYLYAGKLRIKNGGGAGINIESTFFDVIPGAISGTIKSNKLPKWTFTYSLMTTNSSFIKFEVRNSMVYDVLSSNLGDEFYQGQYSYSNKMRENGLSFGTAKRINKKIGVGASVFVVYNSQEYRLNQEATASRISNGIIENTLAFSRVYRELSFGSVAFIMQLGFVYKLEKTKLAINLTSPKMNIDLFATATVAENVNIFIPFGDPSNLAVNRYGKRLKTIQKSPIKIAAGFEHVMQKSTWNFKVTYYSGLDKYARVVAPFNEQVESTVSDLIVFDEANETVNVAVGLFHNIREGLSFLGGARTDFNFAKKFNPEKSEFIARMSYWNLYHITGGVIWHTNKLNLTLGGDAAFGFDTGRLQQVNLTNPTEQGLLFGEITPTTKTFHNQFYIVLGISYKFE